MNLDEEANHLRDHALSFVAKTYMSKSEGSDCDDELYRDLALTTAKVLRNEPTNYMTCIENSTGVCYANSVFNLFLRLDSLIDFLDAFRHVDYGMIQRLTILHDRIQSSDAPYVSFPSDLFLCDEYGGCFNFFSKTIISHLTDDLYKYYQKPVATPFDMTLYKDVTDISHEEPSKQTQQYITLHLKDTDECRDGTAKSFIDGRILPHFDLEDCLLSMFVPLPFGSGYQFAQTPRLLMLVLEHDSPGMLDFTCSVPSTLCMPAYKKHENVRYELCGVLFSFKQGRDDRNGHAATLLKENTNGQEQEWLYDNETAFKNPLEAYNEKIFNDGDTDYDHYPGFSVERGLRWLDQPIGSPTIIVYERVQAV